MIEQQLYFILELKGHMHQNSKLSYQPKHKKLECLKKIAHFNPNKYLNNHVSQRVDRKIDCFDIQVGNLGKSHKFYKKDDNNQKRKYLIGGRLKTEPNCGSISENISSLHINRSLQISQQLSTLHSKTKRSRQFISIISKQKEKEIRRKEEKIKMNAKFQLQKKNFQRRLQRFEVQFIQQQHQPNSHYLAPIKQRAIDRKKQQRSDHKQLVNSPGLRLSYVQKQPDYIFSKIKSLTQIINNSKKLKLEKVQEEKMKQNKEKNNRLPKYLWEIK